VVLVEKIHKSNREAHNFLDKDRYMKILNSAISLINSSMLLLFTPTCCSIQTVNLKSGVDNFSFLLNIDTLIYVYQVCFTDKRSL